MLKRVFLLIALCGIAISSHAMKREAPHDLTPSTTKKAKITHNSGPESSSHLLPIDSKDSQESSEHTSQEVFFSLPEELSSDILCYTFGFYTDPDFVDVDSLFDLINTMHMFPIISPKEMVEVVRNALKNSSINGYPLNSAIRECCRNGDADMLRILCCVPSNQKDLYNAISYQMPTPGKHKKPSGCSLHLAAQSGHDQAVAVILHAAGDRILELMMLLDENYRTPLMISSAKILAIMLEAISSDSEREELLTITDIGQKTLLQQAVIDNHIEKIQIILNAVDNQALREKIILSKNAHDKNALDYANEISDSATSEAIKSILGSSITNAKSTTKLSKKTVLKKAVARNKMEKIKTILNSVDNQISQEKLILTRDSDGKNLLDFTDSEKTKTLLESYIRDAIKEMIEEENQTQEVNESTFWQSCAIQ